MEIKNVVVAGGGVLGSQIALQSAFSRFNVTIWLRSEGSIERCQPKLERLRQIYLRTLESMKTDKTVHAPGLVTPEKLATITDEELTTLQDKVNAAYESIKLTTSYDEAFGDSDLVIEAVAEDPSQKAAFYTEMAKHLPEKTIVTTNSSTLLPSQLAESSGRPAKYLAIHFANNIWIGNTAEIMGHPGTDEAAYNEVVEFARAIAMVPILLHKEQPAYVLNSLLVPFLSAAETLWANDVASPEDIDKTWKIATGAPRGPFQIMDIVGLTTVYNIGLTHPGANDPESVQGKILARLKEMIDTGKLGINAGEGFYKYN